MKKEFVKFFIVLLIALLIGVLLDFEYPALYYFPLFLNFSLLFLLLLAERKQDKFESNLSTVFGEKAIVVKILSGFSNIFSTTGEVLVCDSENRLHRISVKKGEVVEDK